MEHLACHRLLLALTAIVVIIYCHVTVVVTQASCPLSQKRLACSLLKNKNITLATTHEAGNVDDSTAQKNIQDVCDGKKATRPTYQCPGCVNAGPGGSVCISDSVLKYLTEVAAKGRCRVLEIIGGCHECGIDHYDGLSVDLAKGPRDQQLIKICRRRGGRGEDEGDLIHCEFDN